MELHVKPTAEELDANAKKALDDAEKLENNSPPENPPENPEDKPEDKEEDSNPTPPENPPENPEDKPEDKEEDKEDDKQDDDGDPDYKKKFTESAREGQVLHARIKMTNEAVEKAAQIPEPTEDELRQRYSQWDLMDDVQKQLAKDVVKNDRRFEILQQNAQAGKDIEKWNADVDKFTEDPKTLIQYPVLEGKVEEFKVFCSRPTRRGVEFKDLVSAFIGESMLNKKVIKKGPMFPTGNGGAKDKPKPKSDKLTPNEAAKLAQTDYKKFAQLLREGKIDSTNV